MLENLGKPVILTGSQLPLFETRNDARENLINALMIADISRFLRCAFISIINYFVETVLKKSTPVVFSAFASPNFPTLGKVGTDVLIRHQILRAMPKAALNLQLIDSVAIGVLRIFPVFL